MSNTLRKFLMVAGFIAIFMCAVSAVITLVTGHWGLSLMLLALMVFEIVMTRDTFLSLHPR